jgi:hypothetical protein
MRNWEPKEPTPRTLKESVETDAPDAGGGVWEQYVPAVLAVVLVVVTAGLCSAIVNLR